MTNLPKPTYTGWDAIRLALALAKRAIDEIRQLAREPGPRGEKGDAGQRGAGLEAIEVDFDGERRTTYRFKFGSEVLEKTTVTPAAIYRGVHQEGKTYERGDMVTSNGSMWHSNTVTSSKPGNGGSEWTLAVKHGRDGRDGKDGKDGLAIAKSLTPFGDK